MHVCGGAHAPGHVRFFATPWTVACQVPLSVEFSKRECWSRWSFPTPWYLPEPGTKPLSLASPAADSLPPCHLRSYVYLTCMHECILSCFSHVWLSATPWTIAHQVPLSMEFSKQECWRGAVTSYSRGPSWLRDQIHTSCLLYCHAGSLPLVPSRKPTYNICVYTHL